MPLLPFQTLDVFTSTRFRGNPLAVVIGGDDLDQATMQAVAREFNLSETTFVLPPSDPSHTARVRIFNRTAEMDFAGHPLVGTAFVLAGQRPELDEASFEVAAGVVRVRITRDSSGLRSGAAIRVPRPLSIGVELPPAVIARALRIDPSDVVTEAHQPVVVSNGNPYVVAQLTPDALSRCNPDLDEFRAALAAHPQPGNRFSLHVYHRDGEMLLARMFAPLAGTWEDPATGSANAPLACLLLALDPARSAATFVVHQGVTMGRPSLLRVEAIKTPEGITATIEGACVTVMQGQIEI